jgi:hypothetical protein
MHWQVYSGHGLPRWHRDILNGRSRALALGAGVDRMS